MVAFTGPISEPMQVLRNICVASTAFVARCTLDSLTASDQVFVHALRRIPGTDLTSLARPFILIEMRDFEWNEFDADGCMQPKGVLSVHIEDKNRHTSDYQDGILDFYNFFGEVGADIAATINMSGGLVIRRIDVGLKPTAVPRKDESEDFNFFCGEYDVLVGADFT